MRVVPAAGPAIDLGITETTPTIGIIDYSRRVTDDFGVTTVVERGFARRMSVRMALPFDAVDAVQRRLAGLRATAALWIASEDIDWLKVQGFYKDFELDLATPPISYCTLSVEGLAELAPASDTGGDPAPEGGRSTLQLLQPVTIDDARLVASSVAENDAAAWAAVTNYAVGARVVREHRVYESLIGGNGGNVPATSPSAWLDIGPTNRWAMFDQALGTATVGQGQVSVTLAAGQVRALALLDVVAATVRVQAQRAQPPHYDRTIAVSAGAITFLDLPAVGGNVTVTITGPGEVAIGTLLVGGLVTLGRTEASPTAGITDFSRKEVDDFGDVTIVQRAWAKRMSARAIIRTDAVDLVANRIAAVRAQPSLWIGKEGVDSLTVYGFFRDFSIEVGEGVSKLALSIEGFSAAAKVQPLPDGGGPVNWSDILDPDGTKPADNADVTGDNTAKDTEAVGGKPSGELLDELAGQVLQAAQILIDVDALTGEIVVQDGRITDARGRADQAYARGDSAHTRIDTLVATGEGDYGPLEARITAAETLIAEGDEALADQLLNLRAGYAGNLGQFDNRITTVADAQGSAAQRTTALEARVDALASGGPDPGVAAITARLDGTEFARTSALSAEVARIDNAVAQYGTINARLGGTEFAKTTDQAAIASRTGALESSVNDPATGLAQTRGRVATAEGTIALIGGRTNAFWQVEVNAGASGSFIVARAESSPGVVTSDVSIGGREIHLFNQVDGGYRKALSVVGGNAILTGGLQAGAFIRLGNGVGWPVALQTRNFEAGDGETIGFGTDVGGLPRVIFSSTGLAPLNSGEVYQLRAESLSSTGFIARLRIAVPGTISNQAVSQGYTAGTAPTVRADRGSSPEAQSGNYRYTVDLGGEIRNLAPGEPGYATIYVSLWVRKAGVWQVFGFTSADVYGDFGGLWTPFFVQTDDVYQLGSGAEAFGASIDQITGMTRNNSIYLSQVRWQAQTSSSSTRSATPNGERSIIQVSPQ